MEDAFKALRGLGDLVNKVPDVEKRCNAAIERSKSHKERNVLQCPKDSLLSMHHVRAEVTSISKDSLKTLSKLQLRAHKSQEFLSATGKILVYLEAEATQTELFLEKFGYVPLQDISKLKSSPEKSIAAEKVREDDPKAGEVATVTKNDSSILDNAERGLKNDEMKGHFFALPASPDTPVLPEYFKRNSLHSPECPSANSEKLEDELKLKCEHDENLTEPVPVKCQNKQQKLFGGLPDSPNLPDACDVKEEVQTVSQNLLKKFFDTPSAERNRPFVSVPEVKQEVTFFSKLTASPLSPKTPQTAEIDEGVLSPDLTLYSRRSALLDIPERVNTIDDDTVYHLRGGRGVNQFMKTPESPDLTEFKGLPKMQCLENNSKLPETPPSPELTNHADCGRVKENVEPKNDYDLSTYQIKESQYEGLPGYLKRVIPYNIASECLSKLLASSFALPGEKYTNVTTETKISEVTGLGGKTKSFVFVLQSLKIIQRIHGTEYFDIII